MIRPEGAAGWEILRYQILLPANRIRCAPHFRWPGSYQKKETLARAFSEYDEALSSFFLGLQNSVLVCIGKEGNVIWRRYLVSLTTGGHESERDKWRFGRDLTNFSLFRMNERR
ncbi:MAG TPA: hypothetical protein VK673_11075 [Chthoniobacterales bacterium]|nr:hypothetical protein [Chthoniobacterales bacterium]